MAERPAYFDKYKTIVFERSNDGVLVVRLHTDNGPCVYGSYLHLAEWPSAFFEIGADRGNRVVVLTGTGDVFIDQHMTRPVPLKTAGDFYVPSWNVKTMLLRLLDIECPIICAINGPATIHSELVAMGQITLASETAYFADEGHFPKGEVPADGVQLVWQELLGVNRGSYFLMTGQRITAREGLALGFINEVLPHDELMPRAMELAHQLATYSDLTLRFTRLALVDRWKRIFNETIGAGYGMALESLAHLDRGWMVWDATNEGNSDYQGLKPISARPSE